MARGPVEMVVVEFPDEIPGRRLATELEALTDRRVIRIVDLTFVAKATDGTVTRFELADRAGEPGYEALDTMVDTMDGLIAEEDLAEVATDIDAGSTAAVLLFEHVWARQLRSILTDAGGEVIFTERIPGPVVDAVESVAVPGLSQGVAAVG